VNEELDVIDQEAGSHSLRKALYRAFHMFAVEHGISVAHARVLLMDRRMPA
jgi:hypothetical protein